MDGRRRGRRDVVRISVSMESYHLCMVGNAPDKMMMMRRRRTGFSSRYAL